MRTWIIFLLVALAYVALATHRLPSPGIFQDEAAFVPVSLNIVTIFNSDRSFLGQLLFEVDYVGALKAWLNKPFYLLFGVSVETIRLPGIFALALTLFLSGIFLSRIFGLTLALTFLLLLGLNPNIIAFTKADFVPFTLSLPIKLALFYLLWIGLPSWKHLVGAILLFGLGIFHRLDFLASAAALLVAFAGLTLFRYGTTKNKQEIKNLTKLAVLAASCLFFWWAMPEPIFTKEIGFASLAPRFANLVRILNWNLEGSSFLRWHLNLHDLDEQQFLVKIALLLVLCPLLLPAKKRTGLFQLSLFVWLYLSAAFFCVLAIPRAASPHHLFALEPFWELGIAASLGQLCLALPSRFVAFGGAALVMAFWTGTYAVHFEQYMAAYSGKFGSLNPFWSEKIYEVANLHSEKTETVFLGWGAYGPVAALRNDFTHVQGIYAEDPLPELVQAMDRAKASGRFLQVLVPDYYKHLSANYRNRPMEEFEELLGKGAIQADRIQQIKENENIFFTAYRVNQILAFPTLSCRAKNFQLEIAFRKNQVWAMEANRWKKLILVPKRTEGFVIRALTSGDSIPGLRPGDTIEISGQEEESLAILRKQKASLPAEPLACKPQLRIGPSPFSLD